MKYILWVILVLFISCKSSKKETKEIETIPLTSQCLLKNTDLYMTYAYKIKVQDSLICLWDLSGGEKFYHLYSYPDPQFITSFVVNGRGPEEYTSTGGFSMDQDNIYIFDTGLARLSVYRKDSLMQQHTRPQRTVLYPDVHVPILNFCQADQGFAVLCQDGQHRVTLIDTSGHVLAHKYPIPWGKTISNANIPDIFSTLWNSCMDYNPDNHLLAIATTLGNVLEIYNLSNDSSRIIVGPGGEPDLLHQGSGYMVGKIHGFMDVQVKKNAIYTLYDGRNIEETFAQDAQNGCQLIQVYDLEGRLIRKYLLDQYVDGIDVHEESGTIFTISSSGDNALNRYKLPS